jgi:hypothetical protein
MIFPLYCYEKIAFSLQFSQHFRSKKPIWIRRQMHGPRTRTIGPWVDVGFERCGILGYISSIDRTQNIYIYVQNITYIYINKLYIYTLMIVCVHIKALL